LGFSQPLAARLRFPAARPARLMFGFWFYYKGPRAIGDIEFFNGAIDLANDRRNPVDSGALRAG
jgi:hypothetical protein